MTNEATLRRGQTCWHLNESVGSIAINFLLTKYYSRRPNYLTIVEMVHDTTLKMRSAQWLDLLAAKSKDFRSFDMEFYKEVVRLKTSHFGFFLPMASALVMVIVALEHANPQQRNILLENHGRQNQEQVEIVKTIFAELKIEEYFRIILTLSRRNIEKSVARTP
ncbi:unnamed protein product [Allacma fusca]|uniref:Uncharacterized protein n=1 Tax=Allacma fusca TaxID=39272 RepID=A0A8J2P9G8_9HEXA|nr:unnamed protein product [Allacma fusca]